MTTDKLSDANNVTWLPFKYNKTKKKRLAEFLGGQFSRKVRAVEGSIIWQFRGIHRSDAWIPQNRLRLKYRGQGKGSCLVSLPSQKMKNLCLQLKS